MTHLSLGIVHAIIADAERLQRVPRGLGVVLRREGAHQLQQHGSEQCGECQTILMIVDIAEVHRLPQALDLQLDAHDYCPVRIVGARQHRVLGTTASLSDDPLAHHHLAPMASRGTATTARWSGRVPATRGAGRQPGDAWTRH